MILLIWGSKKIQKISKYNKKEAESQNKIVVTSRGQYSGEEGGGTNYWV